MRDFCCPGAVGDPWVVFPWDSGQKRHSCQQPGAGSSELNPSLVSLFPFLLPATLEVPEQPGASVWAARMRFGMWGWRGG